MRGLLTLRCDAQDHQSPDGTPITTRQLESMIRLAEARAKAELREVVTEQDAIVSARHWGVYRAGSCCLLMLPCAGVRAAPQDVVDVMKESLYDVMADELGHVDFKRSKGISKAKQTSAFMKQLHRLSEQRQNAVFTFQVSQAVRRSALHAHHGLPCVRARCSAGAARCGQADAPRGGQL